MSLSKQETERESLNIIKVNSIPAKLKIADYKTFLEEIEMDKVPEFNVRSWNARDDGIDGGTDQDVVDGHEDSSRNEITKAYEEGFETGKTEATKALQVEYEKRVEGVAGDFAAMVRELSGEIEKYNKECDKAIVTLAMAVARRIVAREIEVDEGAVLARSREAIRKIIGVERVKIHVNPADEEYIREHRNDLSNYADSVKEIMIEADGKVERGGCIIESELGNIDARISTQFELIEEAFLELAK